MIPPPPGGLRPTSTGGGESRPKARRRPPRGLCPRDQPQAKLPAASSSVPVTDGEHVQVFKRLWDCKRKFYTVPVQK